MTPTAQVGTATVAWARPCAQRDEAVAANRTSRMDASGLYHAAKAAWPHRSDTRSPSDPLDVRPESPGLLPRYRDYYCPAMARLEEMTPGAGIRGVLPDRAVTVVQAEWLGTHDVGGPLIEVTYMAGVRHLA